MTDRPSVRAIEWCIRMAENEIARNPASVYAATPTEARAELAALAGVGTAPEGAMSEARFTREEVDAKIKEALSGSTDPYGGICLVFHCIECRKPFPNWGCSSSITCPECKQDKARATDRDLIARLTDVLEQFVSRTGWRGSGPLDREEYYCELCGEHHEDCNLIPHKFSCLWLSARTVLGEAQGSGGK